MSKLILEWEASDSNDRVDFVKYLVVRYAPLVCDLLKVNNKCLVYLEKNQSWCQK
jgi:hypothetical protein